MVIKVAFRVMTTVDLIAKLRFRQRKAKMIAGILSKKIEYAAEKPVPYSSRTLIAVNPPGAKLLGRTKQWVLNARIKDATVSKVKEKVHSLNACFIIFPRKRLTAVVPPIEIITLRQAKSNPFIKNYFYEIVLKKRVHLV